MAAVLALAIPFPHRLHCDCLIEPVTRRFVAAPFDGVLERAFVGPGDVVQKGDLLARLDGREIRWKRAGVAADQNQARKKRDAAQASHDYADMQIAALEMERLELELRLLDHRAENLEIRSPVAGVIASGDLERAEGAALKVGQSLFEIAPLDKMIVEVSVPDEDVSFVTPGLPLRIRLDAYPGMQWQATMTQLHPRSEIRDENNVFIAEAELDNAAGSLRPGMKGRARVEATNRPIGWILFHKPWEFISKKLQW
jgi:multidrug resistance efflux pump